MRRIATGVLLSLVLGLAAPSQAQPGELVTIYNPRGFTASYTTDVFPIRVTLLGMVGDAAVSSTESAGSLAFVEEITLFCMEIRFSFGNSSFSLFFCMLGDGVDVEVDQLLEKGRIRGEIGGGTFAGQAVAPIEIDARLTASLPRYPYEVGDDPSSPFDDPTVSGTVGLHGAHVSTTGVYVTRRGKLTGEVYQELVGEMEPTGAARFFQWGTAFACAYDEDPSSCFDALPV